MLWKVWRDLKRITTRYPQRVEIKPFGFSLAYDGDTFRHCSPRIISRLG